MKKKEMEIFKKWRNDIRKRMFIKGLSEDVQYKKFW